MAPAPLQPGAGSHSSPVTNKVPGPLPATAIQALELHEPHDTMFTNTSRVPALSGLVAPGHY